MTLQKKQEVPPALIEKIFAIALPETQCKVTTDAPENVEIVLRQKGNQNIVHLVNLAEGKREETPWRVHQFTKITDIPPARPCHVILRFPTQPSAVHLQPQNHELRDWTFQNNRLEVSITRFAIHRMIVVQNE